MCEPRVQKARPTPVPRMANSGSGSLTVNRVGPPGNSGAARVPASDSPFRLPSSGESEPPPQDATASAAAAMKKRAKKKTGPRREKEEAPSLAWKLDAIALRVLDMAAAAPEERVFEWIEVDDVVSDLSIPQKKAEFYMRRLQEAGLLSRDGEITDRGTAELIRRGRL